MKIQFNTIKIALLILIINFLVSNMEASWGSYNSDISSCQEKFYDWMAVGSQEDEDPLLIEAKNAYKTKEYKKAIEYAQKIKDVHKEQAITMQSSLNDYPWESKEKIFKYESLNTMGIILFIEAKSYLALGKIQKAKDTFMEIKNDYYFSQSYCKKIGYFMKIAWFAELALEDIKKKEENERK